MEFNTLDHVHFCLFSVLFISNFIIVLLSALDASPLCLCFLLLLHWCCCAWCSSWYCSCERFLQWVLLRVFISNSLFLFNCFILCDCFAKVNDLTNKEHVTRFFILASCDPWVLCWASYSESCWCICNTIDENFFEFLWFCVDSYIIDVFNIFWSNEIDATFLEKFKCCWFTKTGMERQVKFYMFLRWLLEYHSAFPLRITLSWRLAVFVPFY